MASSHITPSSTTKPRLSCLVLRLRPTTLFGQIMLNLAAKEAFSKHEMLNLAAKEAFSKHEMLNSATPNVYMAGTHRVFT